MMPQISGPSQKVLRSLAVILVAGVVLAGTFRLGYASGAKGFTFNSSDFKIINKDEVGREVDFSLLWNALDVVQKSYIDKDKIDPQQLLYGAVRGAVAAVGDRYTEFFDPKDLESFRTELRGSFDGIGAEVTKRDGLITVVAPLDDSPAAKAGIKAKDIIIEINGESTEGMTVEAAVAKIRGERGSNVILKIAREGETKPLELTITRAQIVIKSIKLSFKTIPNQKVAILKINRFGDDTVELFNDAIDQIQKEKADSIVLDVRNNPGGYLDAAVKLGSDWVESGKLVVREEHSQNDATDYNSLGFGRLSKIPTVVLINGGSASASEILAGALHDYKIAQLVGEKSFGKGSVQQLIDLPQNSAVKVTVAKWITPSGKNLNKDGLNPDVEVKLTDDDIKAEKDPQMDKALEILNK